MAKRTSCSPIPSGSSGRAPEGSTDLAAAVTHHPPDAVHVRGGPDAHVRKSGSSTQSTGTSWMCAVRGHQELGVEEPRVVLDIRQACVSGVGADCLEPALRIGGNWVRSADRSSRLYACEITSWTRAAQRARSGARREPIARHVVPPETSLVTSGTALSRSVERSTSMPCSDSARGPHLPQRTAPPFSSRCTVVTPSIACASACAMA